MLNKSDKIYVAGHNGLVGSAILRSLRAKGYQNIIVRNRAQLDLLDMRAVAVFFETEKPAAVFIAAAKVGGIMANNTFRADFIYQNTQIQNNIIWQSHLTDVSTLVFLGSSCIYPKMCEQPMKEEHLLSGPLEFTNRPYALAKIAGLELVNTLNQQYGRKYLSAMPTNLYGPGDNFHPENSHVLPALIRRFHEAKIEKSPTVTLWGTGSPKREFMYSDDCADAVVHLAATLGEDFFSDTMKTKDQFFHINVGTGQEVSIAELAETVRQVVGYDGKLEFDSTKPDGSPRKLLDCQKLMNSGWEVKTPLKEGIKKAYNWYVENII